MDYNIYLQTSNDNLQQTVMNKTTCSQSVNVCKTNPFPLMLEFCIIYFFRQDYVKVYAYTETENLMTWPENC